MSDVRRVITVVLGLAVVIFFCGPVTSFLYTSLGVSPYGALPVISLPAEPLPIPWFNGEEMTNTFLTTLIVDALLLLLVAFTLRRARRGELLPGKNVIANMVEAIAEALSNFADSVAGKRGKTIYPLVATLFFLILIGNWFKLLPGAESVGLLETPHMITIPGYAPRLIQLGGLSFYTIDGTKEVPVSEDVHERVEADTIVGEGHESEGLCTSCQVTPFVRGIATDLNFTLALALITMALVQVYGVRAQGGRYFQKFINTPALRRGPIGIIEFAAGFLEIISEISRIISFAFRLLGNIFAGTVLIFVISNLIPFFLPAGFYGLELFVGAIQAAVFALLAMIFINMATVGHGDGEHSPADAHSAPPVRRTPPRRRSKDGSRSRTSAGRRIGDRPGRHRAGNRHRPADPGRAPGHGPQSGRRRQYPDQHDSGGGLHRGHRHLRVGRLADPDVRRDLSRAGGSRWTLWHPSGSI
jgi:F-type H+-transporting ATPase subunit a